MRLGKSEAGSCNHKSPRCRPTTAPSGSSAHGSRTSRRQSSSARAGAPEIPSKNRRDALSVAIASARSRADISPPSAIDWCRPFLEAGESGPLSLFGGSATIVPTSLSAGRGQHVLVRRPCRGCDAQADDRDERREHYSPEAVHSLGKRHEARSVSRVSEIGTSAHARKSRGRVR